MQELKINIQVLKINIKILQNILVNNKIFKNVAACININNNLTIIYT